MKTWMLNHKKITILIVLILSSVWFLGYFMPKQNCLLDVSFSSASNEYRLNFGSKSKYFKTRNDALDYCMAQRWDF